MADSLKVENISSRTVAVLANDGKSFVTVSAEQWDEIERRLLHRNVSYQKMVDGTEQLPTHTSPVYIYQTNLGRAELEKLLG